MSLGGSVNLGDRVNLPEPAGPAGTLDGILEGLPPIGLEEVLRRAELRVRLDRKYLVPAPVLAHVLARVRDRYAALDIGGVRAGRYVSTYFDTPAFLTYRQHLQGRRRRYKVRTRGYLDTDGCMFEIKLEGSREATDKRRMPYDSANPARLGARAWDFLSDTLLRAYHTNPPETLRPTAVTAYRRATLVALDSAARVTCDFGLTVARGERVLPTRPGLVLVESKSAGHDTPMDAALRAYGMRPTRVSKYCVAVAALYPDVRANPWHPALRALFGVSPGRVRHAQ